MEVAQSKKPMRVKMLCTKTDEASVSDGKGGYTQVQTPTFTASPTADPEDAFGLSYYPAVSVYGRPFEAGQFYFLEISPASP